MKQPAIFSEEDAAAVLRKHQRKVTRQRVGVLLYLMRNKKAFTFKQLTDVLEEGSDRVTIYRALTAFVSFGIVGKALNEKGTSCFFYLDHIAENRTTLAYLECSNCDEIIGLPSFPQQYLDVLRSHEVAPTSMLMKGHCKRPNCEEQSSL